MKVTLKIARPSTTTYGIAGKSLEEVHKALEKRAWWGHYEPSLKYSAAGKGAVLSEMTVSAAPRISLPKWSEYGKADATSKKTWDAMLKALTKHESHHHDILSHAAAAFKKTLEAGKDLAKKDLEKAWSAFNTSLNKDQEGYDGKTGNGKTEGVMLTW
jgi:predicted secreted Zn-dependent protease